MITITIQRATLVKLQACTEGLALYDAIAAQQPASDARRSKRLRFRYTPLHCVWLASAYPGFASWLIARALVPLLSLESANLRGANLGGANLRGADAAEIAAQYRTDRTDVPVVAHLDARIAALVDAGDGVLDMGTWHRCETTHCRAGWAVHLAGDAGKALELKRGPEMAGGMIYMASTGRWPDFFASSDAALADIRKCAEADPLPESK